MSTWYKTTLTQSDILAGKHSKMQDDFETIFEVMQAQADLAMFDGRDLTAKERPYYFAIPPDSEMFTKKFLLINAAQPCPKPKDSECSLLVGVAGAFDLLR
ncbi:MAG: hypothetical protein Q8P51_07395 [Ignavibacteria bacterium]|nr:hypothetical protein [Ignavibacteria bacterium]